ncbi:MAG: hypothetical protein M1817_001046 [Caeruleum heppii]|nr:MAG: hypothetical protein M1817_001046 [Caeruleum heppii]
MTPSYTPRQLLLPLPNLPCGAVQIHLSYLGAKDDGRGTLMLFLNSGNSGAFGSAVDGGPAVGGLEEGGAGEGKSEQKGGVEGVMNRLGALGSLVYALPDKRDPTHALTTPLYSIPSTIESSTRIAQMLVRKTGLAAYVGGEYAFGVTVEEEMEGLRRVVECVVGIVDEERKR